MSEVVLLGALAPDGPSRIHRRLDDHLATLVRRGVSINIVGGRQTGKTTALLDLRARVIADGGLSTYVDLSPLGETQQSLEDWLASFAGVVAASLSPKDVIAVLPSAPASTVELRDYFLGLAAAADPHNPVLIVLDEVTGVPEAYRNGFFSAIRALINLRSDQGRPPGAGALQFVFAGSFDPDRLIPDTLNSPFNVSETVFTADFDLDPNEIDEVLRIAASEHSREDVMRLTRGHPYLSNLVATMSADLSVGELADSVLRRSDPNIVHVSRRLTENGQMLALACRIAASDRVPFLPGIDEVLSGLVVLGVVVQDENGLCSIRGEIYEGLLSRLCDRTNGDATRVTRIDHDPLDFVGNELKVHLSPILESATRIADISPAVATVCMGAVVEGVLLSMLESVSDDRRLELMDAFRQEVEAGRIDRSLKLRSRDPADWNLAQLIELARIDGIITGPSSQVSHGLRNWRNLIHPAEARQLFPGGLPRDVADASLANGAVLLREIATEARRRATQG